jgi:hypothetical protein
VAPSRAGVMIADETLLTITGTEAFELVLADLPGRT